MEMKVTGILEDDQESLRKFLDNMAEFDKRFCEFMVRGVDFNLKFEIHGEGGTINHCRVNADYFDRPKGKESKKKGLR